MNQGRIWCVVNPTVGLPLFLGSVAVTSLIVHYSVLSNTSWFSNYWNGKAKPKVASVESAPQAVALNASGDAAGLVISVAPVAGKTAGAETSYVITLAAKPAAPVVAEASVDAGSARLPESLALAGTNAK
jgi:light-harvesting protein B-800-850 alpha chain